MKEMEIGHGVSIVGEVNWTKPDDNRGRTWQIITDGSKQVTVCERKAGSISCHRHNGDDPSKNPELLFIARGEIVLTCYDPEAKSKGEWTIVAGTTIYIEPGIIHKTRVTQDALILELRVTKFDPKKPDTYPAEIPKD